MVAFIGLNPSEADAVRDDPTLRRCLRFARDWGYGGLAVGNLFALRSPDPAALRRASDPVGAENDGWLKRIAGKSDTLVAAWGNGGTYLGRDGVILSFAGPQCLGVTKSGSPRHPLYVPASATLRPYSHSTTHH